MRGFGFTRYGFFVWILLLGSGLEHIKKGVGLDLKGVGGFGYDSISAFDIGLELFDEFLFDIFIFLLFEFILYFFMVLEVEEGLFAIFIQRIPVELKRVVYFS